MHDDRPNLVLLHGWGMNNGVWEALPTCLTERFRVHPIELPGHGDAPFETDWRGLPDWADAVLAQAPQQAIWLGWSLGALVAVQAALQTRRPDRPLGPGQHAPALPATGGSFADGAGLGSADRRLRRMGSPAQQAPSPRAGASRGQAAPRIAALILVTANPRFVQAADWRAAMPAAVFDGFHASLLEDPTATLQRFLGLQVRGSEDSRETLRRLRGGITQRPQPQPQALLAGLDLLREEDLRARLADVQAPALWVFGERDTLVPAAVAERIELLMPNARCQIISGAAHAPLLSHPDQVVEAISAFLQEACA